MSHEISYRMYRDGPQTFWSSHDGTLEEARMCAVGLLLPDLVQEVNDQPRRKLLVTEKHGPSVYVNNRKQPWPKAEEERPVVASLR